MREIREVQRPNGVDRSGSRPGKLYKFEIEVIDSAGVCGRGTHTRAIVSTSRLIEGAKKRALANKN